MHVPRWLYGACVVVGVTLFASGKRREPHQGREGQGIGGRGRDGKFLLGWMDGKHPTLGTECQAQVLRTSKLPGCPQMLTANLFRLAGTADGAGSGRA